MKKSLICCPKLKEVMEKILEIYDQYVISLTNYQRSVTSYSYLKKVNLLRFFVDLPRAELNNSYYKSFYLWTEPDPWHDGWCLAL